MKTIVIFPGRFHPPHLGHKSVYDKLSKKFGDGNVFVGSSNKQAPVSSPFEFNQKKKLWQYLGVPAKQVALVKSPYQAKEITDKFNSDDTVVIFALSQKDADRISFTKKDGTPGYMQPYNPKKHMNPLSQNGYIIIAPTIDFNVLGNPVKSASEVRGMYLRSNEKQRIAILKDLYGKVNPEIKNMFDTQLALTETILKLMNPKVITESLRNTSIIAKARILEDRIAQEEFNFRI